jgi:antirestriction protein ArdC
MLCNIAEIEVAKTFTNSVAYIGSWIKKLENDEKFIISASSKAEKAVKFIIEGKPKKEEDENNG